MRRLGQWQTRDPALNPFIEKGADGSVVGHSLASTTEASRSPKPDVMEGDLVVAGVPPRAFDEGLRGDFVSAMRRALGLTDDDLAVLRSTDPSSATPLVRDTLCAVSVLRKGRKGGEEHGGGGVCMYCGCVCVEDGRVCSWVCCVLCASRRE